RPAAAPVAEDVRDAAVDLHRPRDEVVEEDPPRRGPAAGRELAGGHRAAGLERGRVRSEQREIEVQTAAPPDEPSLTQVAVVLELALEAPVTLVAAADDVQRGVLAGDVPLRRAEDHVDAPRVADDVDVVVRAVVDDLWGQAGRRDDGGGRRGRARPGHGLPLVRLARAADR